jgi:stringent starvation protein B
MQSTKPYLIRAIHEWCIDEGFTPYLAVTTDNRTRVPREFVKDGEIVLNVGTDATHQLNMGNDEISFQARFNGRAVPISVPIDRVAAIYARENGQGMAFEVISGETDGQAPVAALDSMDAAINTETEVASVAEVPKSKAARGSHLTRVK